MASSYFRSRLFSGSLLALVAGGLFLPPSLHAQLFESEHNHPGQTQLTPAQEAKLKQLQALETLPDGPWRFHAGDVAHGESLSLDDSSWQQVSARSTAPKEAVWYRRTIEIPATLHGYNLSGVDVGFRFRANANGPMPEIIYFNGRRVALGDDLESIELFHNAKPGDKVLVAVKLLPTVDVKKFHDVVMKITFDPKRPNPETLEEELMSAAYLVPSLAPGSTADQKTLSDAIGQVDTGALDASNQEKFDASLKQAASTLSSLRPMLQKVNYNLTGNSHIDAAWLWPAAETVDVIKRTFGTAVQLMAEYPTYTYDQSAAEYSQVVADDYPQLNDQIKQRVDEGRWELVGGMWIEPDLNMPDGESQVRQLLVGQETFSKLYGKTTRIGWNPDTFGYNWQLPQIYKRSGVDYFVTQKMTWNDTNQLPLKLFWWEAPDGSKVLTYFPHDYGNDNLDPVRLARDMAVARDRSPGLNDMLDLYGVGDHGGGPTRGILDQGVDWRKPDKIVPQQEFRTAQPFFSKVEKEVAANSPTWNYETLAKGDTKLPDPPAGETSVPTWKDELYLEFHRGVYTTQANHKRNMRDSEEWVLNAEKYASLAWLDGTAYPQNQLQDAWKLVLFNQFHDLAAGSGIGVIYQQAQKEYNDVHWSTDQVKAQSLKTVAAKIDTRVKGDVPVLVFNPLAWQRDGLVETSVQMPSGGGDAVSVLDSKDHVVPSQVLEHNAQTNTYQLLIKPESVPSMGYDLLHVVGGKKSFDSDLKSSGMTMENANLRVVVDPQTGCITSLFDKKDNFETLKQGACGNELQAYHDLPKQYDAWNINPATYDVPPMLIHDVDEIKITEQGPLRTVIQITRHWQNSKFTQELMLYTGSDQVDVSNDVEWHETHIMLKAAFPLAASGPMATYEIPYGTIERPTTRNNSFEKAKFEVPAMRWGDLGDNAHGFSLINNTKYGYDGRGDVLRLTLLRSPTWPDPNADRGHQHFTYALYPHAGTWKDAGTVEHGYNYNYKLQAMQVDAHTGSMAPEHSFFGVDAKNVVVTAVKKAEDGNGLIVRFYEWAGKGGNVTLTVPPGATGAQVVNLMEKPTGDSLQVSGDHVSVPVTPYEIQTVRLDYTPPAAM